MTSTQKAARGRVRIGFVSLAVPMGKDEDPVTYAANRGPGWRLTITDPSGSPLGSWDVWHPHDIDLDEFIRVAAIEGVKFTVETEQFLKMVREQITLEVPDLPAEVMSRLSFRQLLAIGVKASQETGETPEQKAAREADAANPPEGEPELVSSSRSPLADLDGATKN